MTPPAKIGSVPNKLAISAERMSEITRVLASDEFQGRSMGGPGEEKTVAYLIDQFKSMGLKPGNGDSYLQSVPAVETTLLDGDKIALDVK